MTSNMNRGRSTPRYHHPQSHNNHVHPLFPSAFHVPPPGFPPTFDVPPPGWGNNGPIASEIERHESLEDPMDIPRLLQKAAPNPYSDPDSRRRLYENRREMDALWHDSRGRCEFSDSEFSDASVASTDAFFRATDYRYRNPTERQRRYEATGGRKILESREEENEPTLVGDENLSRCDTQSLRSVGRGIRMNYDGQPASLPSPGSNVGSCGDRFDGFCSPVPNKVNYAAYNGTVDNHEPCTKENYAPSSQSDVEPSYSILTDIRKAQDVQRVRRDPVTGAFKSVLIVEEAVGRRPGKRRSVPPAHRSYETAEATQQEALEALLVHMTSKAKRVDERGREFYVRDEIMPIDEDQCHEFKGHRSFAEDEMPAKSRPQRGAKHRGGTRKPISATLNAFLNTQRGGTIYLGVLDSGAIKGLMLTQYQIDHVRGQLRDLFSRYDPPVASHRYEMSFVPVLEGIDLDAEIATLDSFQNEPYLENHAKKRHQFRTPHYCWCDKDAVALLEFGQIPSQYIVEIEIFPWDPDDPKNPNPYGSDGPNIAPSHEDELGRVYLRGNAGNYNPLVGEIVEYAKHQVDKFYLNLLESKGLLDEVLAGPSDSDSPYDDDAVDRVKSKMGLNAMEKTVKKLTRNGQFGQPSEDDDSDVVEDSKEERLMSVEDFEGLSLSESEGLALERKEVDRLLMEDID